MRDGVMEIKLGPIELEVITGSIRSTELEIEAAVERTSRSPMIRDQHDYRVALFDASGRKLTGRSYSALVEPVFEYFDDGDIHPGDVFFWNDPYNSSGGIGHVPDLCTTVPIFNQDKLIGFSQVFGHHDDVGGSVPGSLPVNVRDQWAEGLVIPPMKLYDKGVLNQAAYNIVFRNSRLGEHLRGDVDAEIGAAKLGSRRIVALAKRYGNDVLESAFQAMISNCAETLRRELLPNIADGVYRWEDYVEFDGVERDHPPHAFRLKMTKTADKIHLDLNGTDPEAAGPINWPLDYAEGKFLRKFLAPVLRSMAASPERSAEIDINEGALDVLEVTFPEKGTLVTPTFGKPTGMRFFLFLRIMGAFAGVLAKATKGHIPADHETIRIWGMHGGKTAEDFYLFREVLGGGAPGRPWADGSDVVHIVPNSRNLPVEFSETRFPIRIEQLGLAQDSAGAGFRRGGFGYDKRVRSLNKSTMISNADRSELSCVGINGGKASDIYKASVERVDGTIQSVMGMSDNIVVEENEICRVITTGGGGWVDPLKREADLVAYDVTTGLVSTDAARNDYGVVVIKKGHIFLVDAAATKILRAKMSSNRDPLPLYDRGPGFEAFKKSGVIKYPTDWTDPDEGWLAFPSESYPK